uniref:Lipase n=1 Tax=Stomoxys calcitrans TaxID=35570 RepID=A0A1I8Q7P0_STOCA
MLINLIRVYLVCVVARAEVIRISKIWEYLQKPGEHLHVNRRTTAHRILDLGYPCEEHEVHTEDGYILTIFRITNSPIELESSPRANKPKVFLQHPLFGTSDTWILNGPQHSLPFLLADRGYDVWLGNSRGNLYGRKHRNLTIHDTDFWRFSWHEIGYYDMASMLDYVIKNETINSKQRSLHFIGHSQGTTASMVLLSLRTEYQQLLRIVHLMAPAVYLDNTEDRLLQALSSYLGYHNLLSQQFSHQEFIPHNELFNILLYTACQQDLIWQGFCSPMAFMMEGSLRNKNLTALQICLETHPGGVSTNQLLHFMQVKHSSKFRQFDFGSHENRLRYNQRHPPEYPLEMIDVPLHIWYGEGDRTVNPIDIRRLAATISDVQLHRVPDRNWSHGDFIISRNVREYVYEPLIDILDEYEANT